MKVVITTLFLTLTFHYSRAQVVIAIQNFDGGTPALSTTNTGGATVTGASAAGDRPATSNFYTSATTAYATTNASSSVTSGNVTGLASYTSKYFEFRLASWSMGSTGNGADGTDLVNVDISLDGGSTYSNEIQIAGNSNAFWHYTTGTGLSTTVYDGNNSPTVFTPAGGGNRTTDGYSTVHVDLPAGCSQAIIRIRALNNSANERWTIDDIKLFGTLVSPCTPGAAPTVNASSISSNNFCTSAQINFTGGNGTNRIGVVSLSNFSNVPVNGTNYPANSTFGSGATLGAGNFVVMNGNGNSVTITGLTQGTTYFFEVFEYNGTTANCDESYLTTSVATYSFTTLSGCNTPQIRSILADACSTQEGLDEQVIIENGANALALSDINLAFPSGGTFCNSGCGTNTLQNNATYISQLNAMAGCSLFTFADPIPAGATIVVFTGLTPSYVFDYSTQCPSTQQYYAIFCNNASTAGRFANSGTGTRTMNATFAGASETVTYAPNSLMGDGSFANFDDAGNATYSVNPNCVYPLDVEIINWQASLSGKEVLLTWTSLNETNLGHYDIVRLDPSTAKETLVERVFVSEDSKEEKVYKVMDYSPLAGLNYYQLVSVDRDGKEKYSKIIAVNRKESEQLLTYSNGTIQFSQTLKEDDELSFISLDGKLINHISIKETSNFVQQILPSGINLAYITYRDGRSEIVRFMAGL